MRITLFRGRSIEEWKWVIGCLVINRHRESPTIVMAGGTHVPVYRDTVGQWTTFMDAKARLIFEGDIIQYGIYKYVIQFREETASWIAHERYEIFGDMPLTSKWEKSRNDIRIIGNIYD